MYDGEYPFFQTGDIKAANFYLTEYSQTYNELGLAQSQSFRGNGYVPFADLGNNESEIWFQWFMIDVIRKAG